MARNATHPQYTEALPAWQRARDVLAGEDAVEAAGEKYLPRLDSQSEEEYAAYKARASFFGAMARTIAEYLDLIFRRGPVLNGGEKPGLKRFLSDCDGCGLVFVRYARQVVSEVLLVGRGGSLVLCGDESHGPHVSFWPTESIINWRMERAAGRKVLSEVVLREKDTIRVLKLEKVDGDEGKQGSEKTDGNLACVCELWVRGEEAWVLEERATLKRNGVALPFIPFVFHGPRNAEPEPDRLPLADIIAANLDHYRLDADYKHGLHFAALPTAWVSGFDKTAPLRIGSSTAWVSEVQGASAGFLEFRGAGLGHIERAMEKVERRMALLGAKMLEGNNGGGVELCGLGSIVASLNESLSRVLQIADWWTDSARSACEPYQVKDAVSITMNTDLAARAMTGDEVNAVVAAWRAGAISRETMLDRLKRGEVLPDGRSVAQERALIHGRGNL